MADIANDFEFVRPGKSRKYPWDEWSDGQTRILTKGTDFECSMASIQNGLHVWARRHGLIARTQRVESDRVAVRMEPRQKSE
jgi:hypothetical protein